MTVYVVTNVEMGWDCVCEVFYNNRDAEDYVINMTYDLDEKATEATEEKRQEYIDDSMYVITKVKVQ